MFTIGPRLVGGTRLTVEVAKRLGKPVLQLCRDDAAEDTNSVESAAAKLEAFLSQHQVRTLNVAGPRASQEPEIAAFVHDVLKLALIH